MGNQVGDRAHRATALAVGLTVASGAMDAISFMRLGSVFSTVMTGNLVLLGLSAGRQDGTLAAHAAVALAGFVLGVLAGSRIAGQPLDQRVWPARVTVALSVELVLLAAFVGGWLPSRGHPTGALQIGLLALATLAMGVRSGAVRAIGISGLSTTYLTGTLVGVLGEVSTSNGVQWRSVAILGGLLTGAALAGALVIESATYAPTLPLGLLVVVLAAAPRRPIAQDSR